MSTRHPIFARASLLLAVLLSACQVMAAPLSAPIPAVKTPTRASAAASSASPTAAPARTSIPAVTTEPAPVSPSATTQPAGTPTQPLARAATPVPVVLTPAGRVVVPVLMYHRIRDDGVTRYITTVKAFRQQMQALKDGGYHTITIQQLGEAIRGSAQLPANPIVLTFDDGFLDVYENAFPIMKEMGFTGVAYIITITFQKEKAYGYMQPGELKALAAAGWEIGSHSITHTDLKTSKQGIGNEIQKSKDTLEEQVGVKVHSFAYPFGAANASIEDLVKKLGYDTAVGIGITITHTPKRLYYLSRREVYRDISMDEFRALLQPGEADQYVGTPVATPAP